MRSPPGEPLSYRVEKMRLSKDKKSLTVNDSLMLAGIPPEVFEYRLGKRSGIVFPKRPSDPERLQLIERLFEEDGILVVWEDETTAERKAR